MLLYFVDIMLVYGIMVLKLKGIVIGNQSYYVKLFLFIIIMLLYYVNIMLFYGIMVL